MKTDVIKNKITEYVLNSSDIDVEVLKELRDELRGNKTIMLRTFKTGEVIIPENQVVRVEAQKAYSIFHLENGRQIVSSRNLNYHQKQMDKNMFMRAHRSQLINIFQVEKIINLHERKLLMKGNVVLEFSRRNMAEVKSKLHHLLDK